MHPTTHACDCLLTEDISTKPVEGYRFASWEKRHRDFELAPECSTLRVAAWLGKTALPLCDVVAED